VYWIRIASGQRIRIQEDKEDPQKRYFIFLSAGFSLFRAEGFSYSLDVLNGGLGISKQQFLIIKISNLYTAVHFFLFLVMKTLEPDPESINPNPKHGTNEACRGPAFDIYRQNSA
jgi:hypothetical protein